MIFLVYIFKNYVQLRIDMKIRGEMRSWWSQLSVDSLSILFYCFYLTTNIQNPKCGHDLVNKMYADPVHMMAALSISLTEADKVS